MYVVFFWYLIVLCMFILLNMGVRGLFVSQLSEGVQVDLL